MDWLDSRALGPTDCYAQRFMRPGSYPYGLVPAHAGALTADHPFLIEVTGERPAQEATQHSLRVARRDGAFLPDKETLQIAVGDIVLWNCPDRPAGAFAVIGDQPFFDSASLTNECGFTHAFGLPGDCHWADARGSGLSGVVRVGEVCCSDRKEFEAWRAQISKGVVVMIDNGKAEPAEVDIVVGQTVFFAIVTGPGITITDERLLGLVDDMTCDTLLKRVGRR